MFLGHLPFQQSTFVIYHFNKVILSFLTFYICFGINWFNCRFIVRR